MEGNRDPGPVAMGSRLPVDVTQALVATGVGALSFPVMLGMNQIGLRSLKISSSYPLLMASAAGGISVSIASLISSSLVLNSYNISGSLLNRTSVTTSPSVERTIDFTLQDLGISAFSGVVFFRALGGRFKSVVPSHLHYPGAFAKQWIPAHSVKYANGTEKEIIQSIGNKYGCHSCGTRRVKQYFADHQPPNVLIKARNAIQNDGKTMQQFYPHCPKCSDHQGKSLVIDSKISPILAHGLTLRLHHIFLPTPLILLLLKSTLLGRGEMPVSKDAIANIVNEPVVNVKELSIKSKSSKVDVRKPKVYSNFSGLVTNFPLLIVWHRLTSFINSFTPVGSFHITLWTFSIIAALGTL